MKLNRFREEATVTTEKSDFIVLMALILFFGTVSPYCAIDTSILGRISYALAPIYNTTSCIGAVIIYFWSSFSATEKSCICEIFQESVISMG